MPSSGSTVTSKSSVERVTGSRSKWASVTSLATSCTFSALFSNFYFVKIFDSTILCARSRIFGRLNNLSYRFLRWSKFFISAGPIKKKNTRKAAPKISAGPIFFYPFKSVLSCLHGGTDQKGFLCKVADISRYVQRSTKSL